MPKPTKMPVEVGDVLGGKYRVQRVLGAGGVGLVVQARHIELRQSVAIKILLHDDDEQVARFTREARASVRLRSDHVARVIDVGKLPDATPFMVMELLDGEDLGQMVARERLAVPLAVELLLQACEGIAEAHALGIVHRDLKPQNLFLTRRVHGVPLVKVLDFGLAKTPSSTTDKALTGTLTVMGSPPYMSPEQVRSSRDVDVRTDIWSLGVCLYEMLTGQTPFDAPTIPEICARIINATPTPVEQLAPDIPDQVRRIISKCLANNPSDRFQTILELAIALEPLGTLSSRGAADRVREVFVNAPSVELASIPPPSAAVDDGSLRPGQSTTIDLPGRKRALPLAPVVVVGGAIVACFTLLLFSRRPEVSPASPPVAIETTGISPTSEPSAGPAATSASRPPEVPVPPEPATSAKPHLPRASSPGTAAPRGSSRPSARF